MSFDSLKYARFSVVTSASRGTPSSAHGSRLSSRRAIARIWRRCASLSAFVSLSALSSSPVGSGSVVSSAGGWLPEAGRTWFFSVASGVRSGSFSVGSLLLAGAVLSVGSSNAPSERSFITIWIARSIGRPLSSRTSRRVDEPSNRENRKYSSGRTLAFIGSKAGLARSFSCVGPSPPIEGGTALTGNLTLQHGSEDGLADRTPVRRLDPGERLRAVEDLARDLLAAMRRQAVQHDRPMRTFREERAIDAVPGERGSALCGRVLLPHRGPYIGRDHRSPGHGRFRIRGQRDRALTGSALAIACGRDRPLHRAGALRLD